MGLRNYISLLVITDKLLSLVSALPVSSRKGQIKGVIIHLTIIVIIGMNG